MKYWLAYIVLAEAFSENEVLEIPLSKNFPKATPDNLTCRNNYNKVPAGQIPPVSRIQPAAVVINGIYIDIHREDIYWSLLKSHLPESPRHPGHQIPLALHIRFQPRSTIPVNIIQTLGGRGGKDKDKTTTAPTVTTAATEPAPTPPPEPETEPETEPPAVVYRIKGNSVNVRKEPSTDSRILVQLSNGYEVDYVKRYSNDWDVINYEGQEAYVSSRFLEKVEPVPETEVVPTGGDGAAGQ